MANEFEVINNPDNTPGLVSSGYQQQNINSVAQRLGVDHTIVEGGAGSVTVKIAGPVDVNGIMYECVSDEVLAPGSGAGRYYVRLITGAGATLTPQLTQDSGTFNPAKNSRYDGSGYRVLNWIIDYDGTDCLTEKWLTPYEDYNVLDFLNEPEVFIFTSNDTWVAPRSKFYEVWITAPGEPGGVGGAGAAYGLDIIATRGSLGGEAGTSGTVRQWIDAGEFFALTFTGAITQMQSSGHTISITTPGSGSTVVGCDQSFPGGKGGHGGNGGGISPLFTAGDSAEPGNPGSNGGGSIWGSGGSGGAGAAGGNGGAGGTAVAYGSGGGSGGGASGRMSLSAYTGGAGGAGATGIVVIKG